MTPPSQTESGPPAGVGSVRAARHARISVKHKHRLRDCEGILVFSGDSLRYETGHREDSFTYSIGEIELDDDGFKDSAGKAWHFTADKRDMKDTFRRWKEGTLFNQSDKPQPGPVR